MGRYINPGNEGFAKILRRKKREHTCHIGLQEA